VALNIRNACLFGVFLCISIIELLHHPRSLNYLLEIVVFALVTGFTLGIIAAGLAKKHQS
jgi:hypothetical protein